AFQRSPRAGGPRSQGRCRSLVVTAPREPRGIPVAVAAGLVAGAAGPGGRCRGGGQGELVGHRNDRRGGCLVDRAAVAAGPPSGAACPRPGERGQPPGPPPPGQPRPPRPPVPPPRHRPDRAGAPTPTPPAPP